MLLIQCPYCGTRDISEFSCHGEAHIKRPQNPAEISDEQWGDYQFFRSNPKGYHADRWLHAAGCRKWFNMLRNTATDEIIATYKITDNPPNPPKPSPHSKPSQPSLPSRQSQPTRQTSTATKG